MLEGANAEVITAVVVNSIDRRLVPRQTLSLSVKLGERDSRI